jgi:tetratricopeptide (TPR) repeat protein
MELCRSGRSVEAAALCQSVLDKERASLHPDEVRIARWLNELGVVFRRLGRYRDSEAAYRESLALEQRLAEDNLAVAATLTNLAELQRLEGRLDEAEESARRALSIRDQHPGQDPGGIAETLNNLGAILAERRDFNAAAAQYRRALSICDGTAAKKLPVVGAILHNLGIAEYKLGRTAEAESALQRALQVREQALGPEDRETIETLRNLAQFELLQDHLGAAEVYYARVYHAGAKLYAGEPAHPLRIEALEGLALVYRSRGRITESEQTYSGLIAALESAGAGPDVRLAAAREGLADLYASEARYSKAALLYNEAVRAWDKLAARTAALPRVLGKYASTLRRLKRDDEARAAERKASDILAAAHHQEH